MERYWFQLVTAWLINRIRQKNTNCPVQEGSGILSVAISPDGRMAVSGGDGIVPQGGFGYSSDESNRNLCFWRMPKEESRKK
jgi:hypothetical protein